jgi:acid phosphatase (class A)
LAAMIAIASQSGFPSRRSDATAVSSKLGQPYLVPSGLPDSIKLLPPPPTPASPAMADDLKARETALRLKSTVRYALAVSDAKRDQTASVQAFACAFGSDITENGMPTLYKLLGAMRVDVRASTYRAKELYNRRPPFEVYKTQICSPSDSKVLEAEGSYPSARAAVGWAYAIVLADLNPSRRDAIMLRGAEFGRSRMICDESWQSDVDAARSLANEDLKRSMQNPRFRSDLARARAEVASVMRSGIPPTGCKAESIALAAR